MTTTSPDTGSIPIFLLKTKSTPHDGYEEFFSATKLAGQDLAPTFVPVLEHKLLEPGLDTVRQLLRSRRINNDSGDEGTYGGMIFTSQRAVEAFASLVAEGPPSSSSDTTWPSLSTTPIYTSLPPLRPQATASAPLSRRRQRRDIIPKTLMSDSLPVSERIRVDELEVYGTTTQSSFPTAFASILSSSSSAKTRWVVVFSPTGCEAALRELGLLDEDTGRVKTGERGGGCGIRRGRRQTYVATIGPTTRDYLRREFGFEADVCAVVPRQEGVGEAIGRFMVGLE
ncbi:hypothetical protein VE04_03946 [Pseudogymnoascus sp. 24MN13]|nr:hypothetical protein VE04_03946 [Pseudogymnoascus sp. 24MN13]